MSSSRLPQKDMAVFRDTAILSGWVAGLILIAGLLWFFTQPVRSRVLFQAVNYALEQSGDSRRLQSPLSSADIRLNASRNGFWYTITGGEAERRAFVFAFIAGGTFFPCAALVSPEGKVEEFIPLGSHAERIFARLSPEVFTLYARRVEGLES